MRRLTTAQKKEALENAMISFKFPKKYFLKSDEVTGKRFALASKSTLSSGINIHSDFLSYEELNQYFGGWYDAKQNKF